MGKEWHRSKGSEDQRGGGPAGCMSGMRHFFDFHHILFTATSSTSRSVPDSSSPERKGLEAPRNSLELDETAVAATTAKASTSSLGEEYYGIPVGITIKKTRKDLHLWVEEEDKGNSSSLQAETPRTPNVVARLMGLDILPDGASTPTKGGFKSLDHSPRASSRKMKKMVVKDKQCKCIEESPPRRPLEKKDPNIMGSRSLPDTPRASSERYRDADPRLSLQFNGNNNSNKENYCTYGRAKESAYLCEVQRKKESSTNLNHQENTRSPRSNYYAREIVKQVKESVIIRGLSSSANVSGSSEIRSKRTRPAIKILTEIKPEKKQIESKGSSKCKKVSYEMRFTERVKKPSPQAETAVRSDAVMSYSKLPLPLPSSSSSSSSNLQLLQKAPLSSYEDVKSINTAVTVRAAATATKREASCEPPLRGGDPRPLNGSGQLGGPSPHEETQNCTKETDPEFQYVQSILERAGIAATTHARWYSPSIPIDPFVFHQLELDKSCIPSHSSTLCCNRKLLFHLVEEILSDLLSVPNTNNTNISTIKQQRKRLLDINKEVLLERLWSQIKGFPLADCKVIADIDALVAGDLEAAKVRRMLRHPSVVAEAESIALEIEQEVVDSVIGETAAFLAL